MNENERIGAAIRQILDDGETGTILSIIERSSGFRVVVHMTGYDGATLVDALENAAAKANPLGIKSGVQAHGE